MPGTKTPTFRTTSRRLTVLAMRSVQSVGLNVIVCPENRPPFGNDPFLLRRVIGLFLFVNSETQNLKSVVRNATLCHDLNNSRFFVGILFLVALNVNSADVYT